MKDSNKTSLNVFTTYFIIILAFVLIRMLSSFGLFAFMGEAGEYVFSIVIQIGVLFCLSIFMFSGMQKHPIKQTFKFYNYKKITIKAVVIAIVIGAIVFFLNIFVANFFDNIIAIFGYKFKPSPKPTSYPIYMLFVNMIFTAVLPAICEETAHRGLLLKGCSAFGSKKAIIISALLFGLLHLNIEQFFYATIIGLFLGYVTILCDSIYPAMIIHFMNNALSVYMGFSSFYKSPFSSAFNLLTSFLQNNFVLGMLFLGLLLALLVWLLVFLVRKLFVETTAQTFSKLQVEIYKEVAKKDYLADIERSKAIINGEVEEEERINLEKLMIDKNLEMGLMTELDRDLLDDVGKFKPSATVKAIMIACFILTAGLTLFTFIWGVI